MGLDGLTAIGTAASGIGGAYGNFQAGQQAKKVASYNAALDQQQAQVIETAGDIKKQEITAEAARTKSLQDVYYAAAGVTLEGTPTLKMIDTASQYEMDSMVNDYNTKVAASRARSASDMELLKGQGYAADYNLKAAGSLLTSALKLSDYKTAFGKANQLGDSNEDAYKGGSY